MKGRTTAEIEAQLRYELKLDMRLEQGEGTLRRRAWRRPRALSFLHPFSKPREPFVEPSGAILELSTAALDFASLSVIVSNSNVELGLKLRAWREKISSQPSWGEK